MGDEHTERDCRNIGWVTCRMFRKTPTHTAPGAAGQVCDGNKLKTEATDSSYNFEIYGDVEPLRHHTRTLLLAIDKHTCAATEEDGATLLPLLSSSNFFVAAAIPSLSLYPSSQRRMPPPNLDQRQSCDDGQFGRKRKESGNPARTR